MRLTKFAAPVLATLALAASAAAIADDPAGTGTDDSTVTLVVYGTEDALGTTCLISCDGDALASTYLVPGENYIEVLDTGTPILVEGEEVERSILDEGEGLN